VVGGGRKSSFLPAGGGVTESKEVKPFGREGGKKNIYLNGGCLLTHLPTNDIMTAKELFRFIEVDRN
jgi:hypothetical protein